MADDLERFGRSQPRQLLRRILEEPELVHMVQGLQPRALSKLIEHVGLEDAGEIVALATTEQLERVFDEDLWKSEQPGQDETFDAARFVLWLEVMLEAGERVVADKLVEMSEDLVTLGLERHVLVLDIEQLSVVMSGSRSEDDMIEKALDNCLSLEIDEYRVIARRHDGWDVISNVLLALDRYHHDFLERVLLHCCHAATEYIEDNGGLYEVLTSEDMLESDAAADREDRRTLAGFVAPSAAASFLALARTTPLEQLIASDDRDPITRAYFREVATLDESPTQRTDGVETDQPSSDATSSSSSKLMDMLREAEVLDAPRPLQRLMDGASAKSRTAEGSFKRALFVLREQDTDLFSLRMEELAYLANVLLSGVGVAGRKLRLFETGEAAIAVCNLGLEHLTKQTRARPGALLAATAADKLFLIGWHVLHAEISAPAARLLEAARRQPHSLAAAEQTTLEALRDSCPAIPAAIGASSSSDPRALQFIATYEQVRTVQGWLERFEAAR